MSDGIDGIKELRMLVAGLVDRSDVTSTSLQKATARLHQAGSKLAEPRKRVDADIPKDTVIAISTVVSTYLGNRGKVEAIQYNRHKTWAV